MQTSCKQTSSIQDKIIRELEAAPAAKYRPWTDFELEVIKKYYPIKSPVVLAKVLNRTTQAIYSKAKMLQLVKERL